MGQAFFFDSRDSLFGKYIKKELKHPAKWFGDFRRYDSKSSFFSIPKWWISGQKKKEGTIRFKNVKNTGSSGSSKIMLELKRILHNQLPNMPVSYISRLLFDKKNESIVLQKRKGKIFQTIGGCCFRFLRKKQVLELVFFAISTREQGKGFGKRLMTFLKDFYSLTQGRYIITCADNNAVNFFSKQGFSQIITAPESLWAGYIKDYEETKLMECVLTPSFSYLHNPVYMGIQEFCFFDKFKNFLSGFPVKENGIISQSQQNNKSFKEKIFSKKAFQMSSRISDHQIHHNFYGNLSSFFNEIKVNNFSKPFLEPVNIRLSGAKDYYQKISNAADFRSMEEKIRSKKFFYCYENFFSAVKIIIQNCRNYNSVYHSIFENSYHLEKNLNIWKLNHQIKDCV